MIDPATAFSLAGLLAMSAGPGCCSPCSSSRRALTPGPPPAIVIPALLAWPISCSSRKACARPRAAASGRSPKCGPCSPTIPRSPPAGSIISPSTCSSAPGSRAKGRLERPASAADPLPRPHLPVRPGRPVALPHPPLRVQPPHRARRPNDGQPRFSARSSARSAGSSPSCSSVSATLALYGLALLIARASRWSSLQTGRSAHARTASTSGSSRSNSSSRSASSRSPPPGSSATSGPSGAGARRCAQTVWMLIATGSFELALDRLAGQPGPRTRTSTPAPPFFTIMYALMGAVRGPARRDDPAARLGNRPPPAAGLRPISSPQW